MNTDGFYTIEEFKLENNKLDVLVALNKSHWVFDVHFPNNPIFPGAMNIQVLQELLSKVFDKKYVVGKILNTRFYIPIIPTKNNVVRYDIEFEKKEYELSVQCSVCSDSKNDAEKETFAKISALFIPA